MLTDRSVMLLMRYQSEDPVHEKLSPENSEFIVVERPTDKDLCG